MHKPIIKLTITALLSSTILASVFAYADSDWGERKYRQSKLDVAPVTNQLYKDECGSCHLAFQPGLLPSRSWDKLMSQLDNHFDENAELDDETLTSLSNYLRENSADHSNYKRSRGIINSIRSGAAPLRITETRYFTRKHHELSKRMVEDNPKVGSYSKCEACHRNADKGSYNEHQVNIPGFGQWED